MKTINEVQALQIAQLLESGYIDRYESYPYNTEVLYYRDGQFVVEFSNLFDQPAIPMIRKFSKEEFVKNLMNKPVVRYSHLLKK